MSSQPSSFSSVTNPSSTILFQGHELRNFTLRDWGEFCEYYAFLPYQIAKRQEATKEEIERIFNECIETRKTLDPQHPDIIRFLFSSEGYAKAFELCLVRGGLSKLKAKEIVETSQYEDEIVNMAFAIYDLLGFDLKKKDNEASTDPQTPNQ